MHVELPDAARPNRKVNGLHSDVVERGLSWTEARKR